MVWFIVNNCISATGLEKVHLSPLCVCPLFPTPRLSFTPLRYSTADRLKCMVSSLSHFSHVVGLKDKDGLCSEGLIDQNNCAPICLLKAEQTGASPGLYFHQLFQPLILLTWVVLICCRTAWPARFKGKAKLKLQILQKSTAIDV